MRILALIPVLCVPLAGGTLLAADKKGEIDYLSLAAVMARDGNYDRAEIALQQVDQSDEELDRARFHLVQGIVRLNRGLYAQAAEDFQTSIEEAERQKAEDDEAEGPAPVTFVYLGQALFYSQQYEGALAAMKRAGAKADEIPSTFALRGESLWKLGRKGASWKMLNQGMKRHPQYTELLRRKLYYAIELKLYKVASDLGAAYLQRTDAGYEDYLALGQALVRSGSEEDGLRFLELARLRAPGTAVSGVELARAYKSRQQFRTAASIMERVALFGESEAFVEAAELYRAAGENLQALALNRFIVDSQARLRQRLAIALDMRDYTTVTAMQRDLIRSGLLREDENIQYALAYAHFKEGNFTKTQKLLAGLRSPELFRKGTALRDAMNRCEDTPWSC